MFCFVCLRLSQSALRTEPKLAITQVNGTVLCREHAWVPPTSEMTRIIEEMVQNKLKAREEVSTATFGFGGMGEDNV